MVRQHIHFVTGRLAQHALELLLPRLSREVGFEYSVQVMPITVAALMTYSWVAKHLQVPAEATEVLLPGYCEGDLETLAATVSIPINRGPRDLQQLPKYFAQESSPVEYGGYDIEIVAEINHCPRLSRSEILSEAAKLARDGADVIDVGCEPGFEWSAVGETVRALRGNGHRVSIDSLSVAEINLAVDAGAELVLSVNSSNRDAAVDWGVEVVAIPDEPHTLEELDATVELLAQRNVPLRIDPILEPISFGFAKSVGRYVDIRRRYPDAELFMGIGNLTELTDADSAGINTLLIGICQELGIRSVLTTQVINWARSSVRECDLARRLMFHAIENRVLPKHLEPGLIMLRDEQTVERPIEEIEELSKEIRDHNYRIFVAAGEIHIVSSGLHLRDEDPFTLMSTLANSGPDGGWPSNLDPSHAFYLGYEMCKARVALGLGKNYCQDEALDWGLATQQETRHYLKSSKRNSR